MAGSSPPDPEGMAWVVNGGTIHRIIKHMGIYLDTYCYR